MTIAAVQRKGKGGLGVTSLAIGSGDGWATPTSGNLLVVTANSDATVATPTGYTAGPSVVDGNGAYLFWKISDGTESTVTVTPGSAANTAMTAAEYSGLTASPLDVSNSSTISGSAGTTTTSTSVTTTADGDLVIAAALIHSGVGGLSGTGPTWTNSFVNQVTGTTGNASPTCDIFVGELIAGTAGAYATSASWANSANDRQEIIIAFKAAATVVAAGGLAQVIPPPLLYYLAARNHAQWGTGLGPKTYYVATAGNDSQDGLSPGTAWQTITKVNATTLHPGDRVLFNGGDTFSGSVSPGTSGTASAPIVYSSYGTGNATISSTTADAFGFVSHGGFEVRNLTIVGGATSFANGSAGVDCYSPTTGRYDYILVDSCDISGFEFGVIVGGDTNVDGFTNVTVNNVNAHGNKDTGIAFWGGTYDGTNFSNQNITVTNCTASGNLGDSVKTSPNGIGIVLGMCSNGLVDQCTAHGNGGSNGTGNGPIGIWTYDSTAVTIQRSLSYSNRTSSTTDGGGFDLDNNVTNSTIQYCFAYDNDGAGILGFNAGTAWSGNTIRYNITWGNGRNNSTAYGEMVLGGPVATSHIYGNTCVAKNAGVTPVNALIINATPTGLTFRNNIFVAVGGPAALASSAWATSAAFMQGNTYYQASGSQIKWGATTYTSLATWRAAVTGQEAVSGTNVGSLADPVLVDSATTPAVTDATTMTSLYTGLQLQSTSPLLTSGQDMLGTFGIDPGTRDFWGNTLSVPLSVGANEVNVLAIAGAAASTSSATGAVTALLALTGTATSTSSATGAVTALLALTGTAASTSAATGAVAIFTPIAGTAASTSSATGAVTALLALTGTATSTSSATGAVGIFTPINGTAATTTTATGDLTLVSGGVTYSIAGAAASTSSATGAVAIFTPIDGAAASTSSATGAVTALLALTGTATSTSSATGAVTALLALTGTATTVTTASGSLGALPIDGAAATTTTATGDLTARLALTGTAASTSLATGALTARLALTGAAASTSSATGAVGIFKALNGAGASTTTAAGALSTTLAMVGVATSTTAGTGALTLRGALTGTAVTVTTASGDTFATLALAAAAATLTVAIGEISSSADIIRDLVMTVGTPETRWSFGPVTRRWSTDSLTRKWLTYT